MSDVINDADVFDVFDDADVLDIVDVYMSFSFVFFLCIIGFKISFTGAVGTREWLYVGVTPKIKTRPVETYFK